MSAVPDEAPSWVEWWFKAKGAFLLFFLFLPALLGVIALVLFYPFLATEIYFAVVETAGGESLISRRSVLILLYLAEFLLIAFLVVNSTAESYRRRGESA